MTVQLIKFTEHGVVAEDDEGRQWLYEMSPEQLEEAKHQFFTFANLTLVSDGVVVEEDCAVEWVPVPVKTP